MAQLGQFPQYDGMTTTPERRKAAQEEIARALQSRHHAYVLHYVGESFETPAYRVTAIAARNLGTGVTESFDIENTLRGLAIEPSTASAAELDLAERRMLEAFFKFVRERKNFYWLHWNMRNSAFGFQGLENRVRALGGRSTIIPESQRVDLGARMVDLFGDNYAHPTNRLRSLANRNQLPLPHLLDGPQQAEAVQRHDYAAATRSLLNRVDVMYAVATKAHEGSLKTRASLRDRIAGSGGFIKWAKEHPVVMVFAIASPVVGAIVAGLKLWQMLRH